MASSGRYNNWRQGSGRTPRFNYAFTTFLLEEDVGKPAANDFNPERFDYGDNTALLEKYWRMPKEKRITVFQLLYLLGGDPTNLPNPVALTQHPYFKSLTQAEINDFNNFLDQAKRAWSEEHGERARTARQQINQQARNVRDQITQANLEKKGKRKLAESTEDEAPAKKIVALSISSSGNRSMIAALIVRFVSNRAFGDESIVRKLDWMAASSMGSVLALNLIKQAHMKPSHCINFFWSVYGSNDPALRSKPEKTERFKSFLRENFLETTMGARMARNEASDHIPRVLLTSAMVSPAPAVPFNYKNYNDGLEMCSPLSLSDAGRASSADPTHFAPFLDDIRRLLFISAGPPCNTPVGELILELQTHSPPLEIGALLSVETGKNLNVVRKVRWFGDAQNAISRANATNQSMQAENEFQVDEGLINMALNPQQNQIETNISNALNQPGFPPRYLRLNPPFPNSNSLPQPDWYRLNSLQYKKITQMWQSLLYLTQPNTIAIIDDFHRAYESIV